MKTKEEILQNRYIIDDFVFYNNTPKRLAEKIISLINSRERITLDYGDTGSGRSWDETYGITGRIGYSKGYYGLKYPILVYNARSIGGVSILTDRILSIKTSKGKRLIYDHKNGN